MDQSTTGTADLLVDKDSVYNLVATFIILLGGDKSFANNLCGLFIEYLNKGCTYQDIHSEILTSFYYKKDFRWALFNNPKKDEYNKNLLTHGTRYYHKELKVISAPPTINRDVDSGVITSRVENYFLEPVASYTIQEFANYFYKNVPIDLQAWPMKKTLGMLKYKINQYGIDKLLFMTDIVAEEYKSNGSKFSIARWDDYSYIADETITNIKYTFSDDEPYYTLKQRRLFDGNT